MDREPFVSRSAVRASVEVVTRPGTERTASGIAQIAPPRDRGLRDSRPARRWNRTFGARYGSYFDERGGSCALGAVYEGVYHLPRDHGKLVPDHLERLFRCLDEVTKPCPQGCKKRLPLASMIVHLNDDHRLTREQIAEWLTQESNA